MNKSRIFIASSTESLRLAYAAQKALQRDADVTVWTQGIFELSRTTLESLLKALDEFDFGVFIFSPDDITSIRGKESRTVRDNIVFELGLFIGRLGRERTFIIIPKNNDQLHLPSDLTGITMATFDANRQDSEVEAAMGPACFDIQTAIDKYNSYFKRGQKRALRPDVSVSMQPHQQKKETQPNTGVPPNPFTRFGPLRIDDSTYVKRECDEELSIALVDKQQIAIVGEYQIGKSSLSEQIARYTKDGWRTCFVDFQGIRKENAEIFMKGFYKAIGKVLGSTDTLDELADYLKNQPAILCLDEFGYITSDIAACLVPNLFWLSNEVGDSLRIVICLPTPTAQLFPILKIDNPKYVRDWKHIAPKRFEKHQAGNLIDMLPEIAKNTARDNLDVIMRQSSGRPQALQSLCYRLFEVSYDIQTEIGFLNIINDKNSYI